MKKTKRDADALRTLYKIAELIMEFEDTYFDQMAKKVCKQRTKKLKVLEKI